MTRPKSAGRGEVRKTKKSAPRKRGGKPRVPKEIGALVPNRVDEIEAAAAIPERPRGRFRRAWRFFFGPRA